LPGVHGGPGAGPQPPPGHRHHRGREPGGDGAALFPHLRTDALFRSPGLRSCCRRSWGGWLAGALILEKIAGAGGVDPSLDETAQEDAWITATTLAATLTDAELLDE